MADESTDLDLAWLWNPSVMALLPSIGLLISAPCNLVTLYSQPRKLKPNHLGSLKLAACIAYFILRLALLIETVKYGLHSTGVGIVASSLGLADAVALTVLTLVHHERSPRPSSTISVFLFVSIITDSISFWDIQSLAIGPLSGTFAAMLASKAITLVLEVQNKRRLLKEKWSHIGLEETSGIINKVSYWWMNDLLLKGYRGALPEDLAFSFDDALHPQNSGFDLQQSWNRREGKGNHALLWSILRSNKAAILTCVPPKLLGSIFRICQPVLIGKIIGYFGAEDRNSDYGAGLVLATVITFFGYGASMTYYDYNLTRLKARIRGGLSSLIVSEVLELDSVSKSAFNAVTLITSDVGTVEQAIISIHEPWSATIEVSIAIWLLQREVGWGSIGPIFVAIISPFLMSTISKTMGPARKVWAESTEKRVTATSAAISSMKQIKMLGVTFMWTETIQGLMNNELQSSIKYRRQMVRMNIFANIPSWIAPVTTFGISLVASHFTGGQDFSVKTAFTSLALISLLTQPLRTLLYSTPTYFSALGCLERLQTFKLEADASQQNRLEAASFDADAAALEELGENHVFLAKDAQFSLKPDTEPIMKDLNFKIRRDALTLVVGRVGSGKTILLQALLRDLYVSGLRAALRSGNCAYCSQIPWIVNSTVQQNILLSAPMDEAWYSSVVAACALDKDFDDFPDGDQSALGAEGITLSGGQKQRVAIARALYSRKPVFVADDVLSGLDWTTQAHLWAAVFGPNGLLRKNSITTILATHTLTNADEADDIILLGGGGKIASQGPFYKLQSVEEFKVLQSELRTKGDSGNKPSSGEANEIDKDMKKPCQEAKDVETKEKKTDSAADSKLYWYYFSSIGWKYVVGALLLGIIDTGVGAAGDIWIKIWAEASESGSTDMWFYFGVFVVIQVGRVLVMFANVAFMFTVFIQKSTKSMHGQLLNTTMRAPMSFFHATSVGDLVNRFSKDIDHIDKTLPTALFISWHCLRACIQNTILFLIGNKYLAVIVPPSIVFLYYLQSFYLRTSRQLRHRDIQSTAPVNSHLLEIAEGRATIRAFGLQDTYRDEGIKRLEHLLKPHYLLQCIELWLQFVLEIFGAAALSLLVLFGVLLPAASSKGLMALALVNGINLVGGLSGVVVSWTNMETSLGSVARLRAFGLETPSEKIPADQVALPMNWPSDGHVEFDEVTATYSEDELVEPALKNISLDMQPGENIAVCGRTGSGKSTLVSTIFCLLEPKHGAVRIDGVNLSRLDPRLVRERLICVPQEPTLFPGTIRSNIVHESSYPDAQPSEETIIRLLKSLEIWDAISSHGLDGDIAAASLSQGQKQLVCLARAILKKDTSKVVVLDEAMSAVDEQTAKVMQRALKTEFEHHTVISVVHKLDTVRDFEKVVVMDRGEVVESGKPDDLLEKEGGWFRALWNS